ncbi:FtsB family cell division protein [Deminuibacter soli]|uniref:Septum formation initiator family protein n=1 Tax=Deminuibacter soli TaxID=2291815 RepID=A0A3E1ND80_9BACT|nr:septum formation initiator family protein [Deminuibacter soli]RFM25936.1 septum formation initiator family protein [Deminuibacter soli]
MKIVRGFISIVKNKYLLAITLFAILMLFFDHNDIFTQLERKKQLKALQTSKQFYLDEIEKTKKQLADLQNNPAALEKYARENFYMKRDNEDVYLVEAPSEGKK